METCPESILLEILKFCNTSTLRSCLRLSKMFRKCILYDVEQFIPHRKSSSSPNYKFIEKVTICAMCRRSRDGQKKILCTNCKNGMFFVNSGRPHFKYTKTWHYERFSGRMLYDDYYTLSVNKNTYTLTRSYTDSMWDECKDQITFHKIDGAWELVEKTYESDDHNFPGNITRRDLEGLSLNRLLRICWKGPFIPNRVL